MARKNDCIVNFTELLLNYLGQPDPMLHMLKWLCDKLMEAELSQTIRAEKSERTAERETYRCGYIPRRLDTRMGTMHLLVPKVRQGGVYSISRNRTQESSYTSSSGGFHQWSFNKKNREIGKQSGYFRNFKISGQ